MAKQNRDQQEYNALLRESQQLLSGINNLRRQMGQQPLQLSDKEAVNNIQSLRNEYKGLSEDIRDVEGSASSLYSQLQAISEEILSSGQAMRDGRSAIRKLNDAARQLRDDEVGINELNISQLEKLQEKLRVNKQSAKDAADRIIAEDSILSNLEKQLSSVEEGSDKQKELLQAYGNRLQVLNDERSALIQAAKDEAGVVNGLIIKAGQRIQLEKEIADKIGVTGAAIKGVQGLLKQLGIDSTYISNAFDDSANAMREAAKNGKSITKAGLVPVGRAFAKTLFSAELILGKIVASFFKVDKASADLQQLTGQNSTALAGFNSRLATSADTLQVIADLTRQTGMNAQNIFSPDVLAGAAELKNTMGLAADEAGGLAMIAQTTGGDIDATTDAIVNQTSAFNRANRSAVSQGQILRDVSKTSDGIKASFAGMPGQLAKAASAARRMGMDLQRLDDIANSLLDFESSIEAELEAQLLTGRAINMAKARELAMNNELAELGDELFKNSVSIHEFGRMNRIQQEAQAKALGLTRDELGKIAYQRALEVGMTEDQAAAAAGVRKEDMQRMAVQERLAKAADKLAQAFAPALEVLIPIAELISSILSPLAKGVGFVMSLASGLTDALDKFFGLNKASGNLEEGLSSIVKILTSIPKLIAGGGILLLGKSIKDAFNPNIAGGFISAVKKNFGGLTSIFDKLKGKAQEVVTEQAGGGLADTIKEKAQEKLQETAEDKASSIVDKVKGGAEDKVGELADKVQEGVQMPEPSSPGTKIKEFLTNLSEGLKKMGEKGVLKGALNLIPASIGFIAFIPGFAGVKLAEQINGPKLQAGLTGLANGLKAMNKTIVGSLALGAAAIAFTAIIPGTIGMYLVGAAGPTASAGLISLASGLTAMSSTFLGIAAVAAAGLAFTAMIPGSIGMLLLGAAGPVAAAGIFALVPALVALGTAMMTGVGAVGLTALAAGALALGGALALASPGITAFGTVVEKALGGVAGIITAAANGLTQILGVITPQSVLGLAALGPALISAGAGLTTFSIASLMALPGLGVLGALAAMSTPLSTVGTSLTAVAAGIAAVSAALSTLETEKLNEIKDLVITTAFAAPAVAASGAITSLIEGITGGGEGQSNKELLAEIKLLRLAVEKGGNVYMDGDKVGSALTLGTFKAS